MDLQVKTLDGEEIPIKATPDSIVNGFEPDESQIVDVTFHDIVYEVGSCWRKKKTILKSVSGILPQGVNAIMGPTGSGKTSLLDILAGRKDPSGLSGTVLVGGERQPKNFKCIAGYVVQDDVVMGTLSVRENLHFSASLRLPSSTTQKQRNFRVERVINELGLQACANTKIGTEFIRGVSGGERKRTNIGMELIIEPKVLFLDEPTTGLDANTAVSVVQKLKDLSNKRKCVIIMSIHQPRYSIFKLFDTLTLLSLGNMVYHGPKSNALTYFEDLGFVCEEHENPADYFLDVIINCEAPSTSTIVRIQEKDSEVGAQVDIDGDTTSIVDLVLSYKQSLLYKQNLSNIISGKEVAKNDKSTKDNVSYATNIFWQILVVGYRSMKNLLRNPMTSVFQVMTMIIFALLVGLLYFRLDTKQFNNRTVINDRIGALFFIVMNQVFGNLSAVDVFIRQKALFIHENVSGFYRVSTFFIAKVFTDMIPLRIIPLFFFTIIAYFMVGFQVDVAKFFIFFLTLSLASVTASSLAFAISARISVSGIASLLVAMTFVLSMLFGGFLVSLDSLPVWLRWLKYFSLFRYAIEALSINEMVGQCYFDPTNVTGESRSSFSCSEYCRITNLTECLLPDCVNGTEDLSSRGYEVNPAWLWYDLIGLTGLSLIFLFLTYFNLRTVKKLK